uniref:Secreted protein n=1 Tax=Arundo donax TaxID=35708 RepID=A0A0A8Y2J2_ARUDO
MFFLLLTNSFCNASLILSLTLSSSTQSFSKKCTIQPCNAPNPIQPNSTQQVMLETPRQVMLGSDNGAMSSCGSTPLP